MVVVSLLKAELSTLEKILACTRALYQTKTHDEFMALLMEHQKKRNFLFQGYVMLEEKIIAELKNVSTDKKNELKNTLTPLIQQKEQKIAELLKLDNLLVARIEKEQDLLDQKMLESKKSRKQLSHFMSEKENKAGKSLDVKL